MQLANVCSDVIMTSHCDSSSGSSVECGTVLSDCQPSAKPTDLSPVQTTCVHGGQCSQVSKTSTVNTGACPHYLCSRVVNMGREHGQHVLGFRLSHILRGLWAESTCSLLLSTSPSRFTNSILLRLKADACFAIPQRAEEWVDLGTAVRVCSHAQGSGFCDEHTLPMSWDLSLRSRAPLSCHITTNNFYISFIHLLILLILFWCHVLDSAGHLSTLDHMDIHKVL